jgi:hypothetical protein
VVWGAAYTDAFLNVCVRSLLSPGNLPVFAKHTDSHYTIYTTEADFPRFQSSAVFGRLTDLVKVEFGVIRVPGFVDKYKRMTQCHAHGISSMRHEDCGFFIMSPDVVWADGSFARLLELSRLPTRLIAMATMPRVVKETFLPAYANRLSGRDALSPRDLVSLSLEHMHPVTRSQFWDDPARTGTGPGDLLWRVGDEGFVVRAFQLQPVLIRPVDRDAIPEVAFDADYPRKACPNPTDVLVITDSDEVHCVDFTSLGTPNLVLAGYQTVEGTTRWAAANTDTFHRALVTHTVRIHRTDMSHAWTAAERRSDEVIAEVLSRLEDLNMASVPKLSLLRYVSWRFFHAKWREKGSRWLLERALLRIVAAALRFLGLDRLRVRTIPG